MPKILFVCTGNVGRSQMAEAFYNYFTKSKNAFSAGLNPNTPIRYQKLPELVCQIMLEEGIDVSKQKVKMVNEQMVKEAEKIFVMASKKACPNFLLNSNKLVFWKIKDPYKMNTEDSKKIRNQIKAKILSII